MVHTPGGLCVRLPRALIASGPRRILVGMGTDTAAVAELFDFATEMKLAARMVGVQDSLLYSDLRAIPSLKRAKLVALWLIKRRADDRGMSHRTLCLHNPALGTHQQFSTHARRMNLEPAPDSPAARVYATFAEACDDGTARRRVKRLKPRELEAVAEGIGA